MRKLVDLYDVTCYLYDDHGSCSVSTEVATGSSYLVDATLSRRLTVRVRTGEGWVTKPFDGRPDFVQVTKFIQDTLNTGSLDDGEQGANSVKGGHSGNSEHYGHSNNSGNSGQDDNSVKPGHRGDSGHSCNSCHSGHLGQSCENGQWSVIGEDRTDVVVYVEWLVESYSIYLLMPNDDVSRKLVVDNCADESFWMVDEWFVSREDAVEPGSLIDVWEMAEREVDVEVEFASAANEWLQMHLTADEMNAILEKKHQSAATRKGKSNDQDHA